MSPAPAPACSRGGTRIQAAAASVGPRDGRPNAAWQPQRHTHAARDMHDSGAQSPKPLCRLGLRIPQAPRCAVNDTARPRYPSHN
ncbi:hypothetical protein XAC3612_620018 [Xanthomonas citri pv. citri]|nr:hypothetical protein XAC3612_620018 [Xanthomonas citri pv. citri]